jgi:uncharacterized protein (DUF302 family)
MRHRSQLYRALALVLVLLLSQTLSAYAQTPNRVDKTSASDFGQTVKKLETAIKKRGFMIVATIDHQNMLRMVGTSIPGAKTIEFGKPDMMKNLLPDNPDVGLEMPLKIYVSERTGGRVIVSFYRPSAAFGAYDNPMLKQAGQMMDMMLEEIVNEAAG